MENEFRLSIILEDPPAGVDFALQKGRGNDYGIFQKQRSDGKNLLFECNIKVKPGNSKVPVFLGPFTQGTAGERFVYVGIGTFAGQIDSHYSRRLKIPLRGITPEMIQQCLENPEFVIETSVPGTGKDGGPNCGTVKPFTGWKLRS